LYVKVAILRCKRVVLMPSSLSSIPHDVLRPSSRELPHATAAWVVLLVVDDEAENREPLATLLESAGYRVMNAANGAEALHLLATEHCDGILLDLMMPVMNGWVFRQHQQADPAIADIPVLLMSAASRLAEEGGALKAAAHLPKPVRVDYLLETIARTVSQAAGTVTR
jgi:two-component system, chemotaxis family, chemotaxis protein CheY